MRSPIGNHQLRRLEGNAADIHSHAVGLITLSDSMGVAARELNAISDSSVHKSKGTDKLAASAATAAADLSAAASRYEDTGHTLKKYAEALQSAQSWIHPRIDDIEDAERRFQLALDERDQARSDVAGLEHRWPWEDVPTAKTTEKADDALHDAATALRLAEDARDELWTAFDSTFTTWSDAYDEAVHGVQSAMDTADNNDGFWENVDSALTVLGWVLVVLSVVALIIGAPFTGVLAAIILTASLISLGLTLLQAAHGRATASDVAWSVIGLLPFGIGKLLARGVPAVSAVISGGRGVVTTAIREALPAARFWRPQTWITPLKSMFAPVTAWRALPSPGIFVNPLKSIPLGGADIVQLERFLDTMNRSRWNSNPAVQGFIQQTADVLPNVGTRVANVALWAAETVDGFLGATNLHPELTWANPSSFEGAR